MVAALMLPVLAIISILPDLVAGELWPIPGGDVVSAARVLWAAALSAVAGLLCHREGWQVRGVVIIVIMVVLPATVFPRAVWVFVGAALQASVWLLIALRWVRAHGEQRCFLFAALVAHGFGTFVLYPACQWHLWERWVAGSSCAAISPALPYVVAAAALLWSLALLWTVGRRTCR